MVKGVECKVQTDLKSISRSGSYEGGTPGERRLIFGKKIFKIFIIY